MRYIEAILRPVENVHPVEERLAATPEVTPVAIHQLKLVDDGSCIALLQVRGNLDRLRDVLSDFPPIMEYAVAGDDEGYAYIQSDTHAVGRQLLRMREETEALVQMPLRHTADGGIRVTGIGDTETFQELVQGLPDEFDVELERLGEYQPERTQLFSNLTPRQQEILSTAVSAGYYESPRRASQADLADRLDISPAAVSQHLQRIEAKVFSDFIPHEDPLA